MDNWSLRGDSDSTTYDYGYGGYYNPVIGYSRYDDTYGGYYNSVTGYSRPGNDSSSRINSYGEYNTHINGGK